MHRIAGVILAGGKGSRIGGGKPLLPFGDGVLLDAVIKRVRGQVGALTINVPAKEKARYRERFGDALPLISDAFKQGTGPLAGIVASLEWAASLPVEWVATFPCDTPFLPDDLVSRLAAARLGTRPVAAEDDSGVQGVCGLWHVSSLASLRCGVESGALRSVVSALTLLDGTRCRFEDGGAFFNINTQEDLQRARNGRFPPTV